MQRYNWRTGTPGDEVIDQVRKKDEAAGGNAMTDGPFIESKETIGGYWFIQAERLEEAAEIARGCPGP
jgi:hypothetical protein